MPTPAPARNPAARLIPLCLALLAGPLSARAQEGELVRLEALLDAQQRRIAALREQLDAQPAPAAEDLRNEYLRDEVRQILLEPGLREGLAAPGLQAGYDRGFFLRSADESFLMRFHGRLQFRWSHYARQSRNEYRLPRYERDDLTGFDVKRIRFHIDGHVYTKDLSYFVKWMADSPLTYDVRILYAFLNYRFADQFQFKAGIFQLAGTRASFQSSANMQFAEYPVFDAVYTTGEGVGVRFWGLLFENRFEYFFDVINALNGRTNQVITPDANRSLDNNPALALRGVWHVLGDAPLSEWVSWADIEIHQSPALDLGFHYAFSENDGDLRTTRIVFNRPSLLPGGFGVTGAEGLQIHQLGLESGFKYCGFSLYGEYAVRVLDIRNAWKPPFTPLFLLTGETSTVAQHGGYVQAGYFLPIPGLEKKLELVARVEGIGANTEGSETTCAYSGGVNYYFEGNRVKLQADVTRIEQVPLSTVSWLGNANDDALIFRVQLQVAF